MECQVLGPHNTKLHRISQITESYEKKYYRLMGYRPLLFNRLVELRNTNAIIDEIIEKLNMDRKKIERDIRANYSNLKEKVKNIEGKKLAVLNYESSVLQNHYNSILDIINVINDYSNNEKPDLFGFLFRYKQIMKVIDKLCMKEVKDNINLNQTSDFPNELEIRHKKLEEYQRIREEVDKKDETILSIIKEKKDKEKGIIFEQKEKSKQEIEEWVKLSDRYQLELKKYSIVCSFCGKFLDKAIVNGQCEVNEQFDLDFYFTKLDPPQKFINSKLHYFSEPYDDLEKRLKYAEAFWKNKLFNSIKKSKGIKEEGSKEDDESALSESDANLGGVGGRKGRRRSHSADFTSKLEAKFKKFGKMIGKSWVIKLAKIIQSQNIDLKEVLSRYDENKTGYIDIKYLKDAFTSIDSTFKAEDFENVLEYFNLSKIEELDIEDFSRNFNSKFLIHLTNAGNTLVGDPQQQFLSSTVTKSQMRYAQQEGFTTITELP